MAMGAASTTPTKDGYGWIGKGNASGQGMRSPPFDLRLWLMIYSLASRATSAAL